MEYVPANCPQVGQFADTLITQFVSRRVSRTADYRECRVSGEAGIGGGELAEKECGAERGFDAAGVNATGAETGAGGVGVCI